jgi:hypothetical protein
MSIKSHHQPHLDQPPSHTPDDTHSRKISIEIFFVLKQSLYKALLSGVEELGRNDDGGRASDDERHSGDGEIDGAVGVGAGNGDRPEGDEAREPGLRIWAWVVSRFRLHWTSNLGGCLAFCHFLD